MTSILIKGVVRKGRVEVAAPIDLPDGSEVFIASDAHDLSDNGRSMTPSEIAETLAAMERVEPFDMTQEERADADAWEKKVTDYSIANLNKGIEDVLP